jgi:hypothetical protein
VCRLSLARLTPSTGDAHAPRVPGAEVSPASGPTDARGLVGLVGLILSIACPAVLFPAENRLASPVVCPGDTVRSIVVFWSTGTSRGSTAQHWALYCIDGQGFGAKPNEFLVWATTAGASLLVVAVVLAWMTAARRAR